jgi:adenylate cyclase
MASKPSQSALWASFIPYLVARDLAGDPERELIGREERLNAVVLFADISGFTAISELLATRGRSGAETLTGILNAYFQPIIALVESYGGIITGFGGDALTAIFPYEREKHGVARRALASSLAIQRYVTRHAQVQFEAGQFAVSLRVGLAAGNLLRTVVGDPALRMEQVIAGAALNRAVEAEQSARPGEVAVDAAIMDELGPVYDLDRRSGVDRRHLPGAPPQAAGNGHERRTGVERRGSGSRVFYVLTGLVEEPAPAPLPALAPLSPEALRRAAPFLPPTLARRMSDAQTGFLNEHRQITAVFLAFEDLDYDNDPTAGSRLSAYLTRVFRVVQRYDGYVNKVAMGDKGSTLLALFGAPIAHEDDTARALHCALELRDLPELQSRIGIAGGAVFSGQVGSASRQEYTVIGASVNLAVRLMDLANPGQILVSEATSRAAGAGFAWAGSETCVMRGMRRPVTFMPLAGTMLSRNDERTRAVIPVLVNRETELTLLRERLETALLSHGQVVTIGGDAGMGKSALAATIAAEAGERGARTISSECISYRNASNYLVWSGVLRGLIGLDQHWKAEQQIRHLSDYLERTDLRLRARMPLLGALLGLPIPDNDLTRSFDAQTRKNALEALLVDLIAYSAGQRPLLLVLESCHWIDALSRDVLQTLTRRAAGLPLLLLVTYRDLPEREPPLARLLRLPHVESITLHELDHVAATRMIELSVARIFGEETVAPEALISRIYARTGGNPLFIEEMLALIYARNVQLDDTAALARLELPENLHNLVLSRIDRLTESARDTLKVASVIGQEFSPGWLRGVYPQLGNAARIERGLEDLQRSDLTIRGQEGPEPAYLFKHVITREVVYNSLARSNQIELHGRAGAYFEQTYAGNVDRYLDLLAYHYGLSDNRIKQREYYYRAAVAAQESFANEAAITWYQHLLPLLHEMERTDVLLRLGGVLRHTGRWDQAESYYNQALEIATDPAEVARTRRFLGELFMRRGDFAGAREQFELSRALYAEIGDRSGEADTTDQLGMVAWSQSDHAGALTLLENALEIATKLDDPGRLCQIINNTGLVHWAIGDLSRALDCFEQCLKRATTIGNRQHAGVAVGNMGNIYMVRGDYGRALECYQQKLQCAIDIGDRLEIGISVGNMGNIYENQGELARAMACYTRYLEITLDLGDRLGVGLALWSAGTTAAAAGTMLEAEGLIERAVDLLRAIDAPYELASALVSRAELALQLNDPRGAYERLSEALPLADASENVDARIKCQLLMIEIDHQLKQLTTSTATAACSTLIEQYSGDDEQAAIYYTLVQIDGARADDRTTAARYYRALHARTPHTEYRRRYLQLMGVALPPPPALPPLPAIVTDNSPDRDSLIDRADALLTESMLSTVTIS